jgi:hypothetical protein
MYSKYKSQLDSLSPVAVRLSQSEINAPDHSTWGVVTCDVCNERFAIGPNRIVGARMSEEASVKQFETILAREHHSNHPHSNSYELSD